MKLKMGQDRMHQIITLRGFRNWVQDKKYNVGMNISKATRHTRDLYWLFKTIGLTISFTIERDDILFINKEEIDVKLFFQRHVAIQRLLTTMIVYI
jgi:hypothetical protein